MKLFLIFLLVLALIVFAWVKAKKVMRRPDNNAGLKLSGIPLTVHLEDCEILSRKHSEQAISERMPTDIEMLDGLGGRPQPTISHVMSQIRYRHKDADGKTFDFVSPVINLEEDMIRFYFMQQQTTTIYIDPSNKHIYYFDLEFMYRA